MMIYVRQGKSKPKLKPKKERDEYEAWLTKHRTPFTVKKDTFQPLQYSLDAPAGRSTTKHIKSLDTGGVAPAAIHRSKVTKTSLSYTDQACTKTQT